MGTEICTHGVPVNETEIGFVECDKCAYDWVNDQLHDKDKEVESLRRQRDEAGDVIYALLSALRQGGESEGGMDEYLKAIEDAEAFLDAVKEEG